MSSDRLVALDGLRGISAAIVVLSHLVAAFYPALYFGRDVGVGGASGVVQWAYTPFFLLWSGTFAVFVFFVLSGFVIAGSAALRRKGPFTAVVGRYLRLAIPALFSVITAWTLISMLPGVTQLAAQESGNIRWLSQYYGNGVPSLSGSVLDALGPMFVGSTSYLNPVLWTMKFEFLGSATIYLLYLCVVRRSIIIILCAIAAAGLLTLKLPLSIPVFVGFPLGVLLYEACSYGWHQKIGRWWVLILAVGLFLGGQPYIDAPLYGFVKHVFPHSQLSSARSIGAALIVLAIISSPLLSALLARRIPQFLGRISFSLYLVHLPLLLTVLCMFYLEYGDFHWAWAASMVGYLALVVAVAYGFTRLVDEPTIHLIKRLRLPELWRTPVSPMERPHLSTIGTPEQSA